MSCDPAVLDALAAGELSGKDAADAATHVATCGACAKELRLLAAEQKLFERRRVVRPLAHVRKAVMAQTQLAHRERRQVMGLLGGLAFACTLLIVSLAPLSKRVHSGATIDDVGVCGGGETALCLPPAPEMKSFSRALHSGGELVAEAETDFHACLVASPAISGMPDDACQ